MTFSVTCGAKLVGFLVGGQGDRVAHIVDNTRFIFMRKALPRGFIVDITKSDEANGLTS